MGKRIIISEDEMLDIRVMYNLNEAHIDDEGNLVDMDFGSEDGEETFEKMMVKVYANLGSEDFFSEDTFMHIVEQLREALFNRDESGELTDFQFKYDELLMGGDHEELYELIYTITDHAYHNMLGLGLNEDEE